MKAMITICLMLVALGALIGLFFGHVLLGIAIGAGVFFAWTAICALFSYVVFRTLMSLFGDR